MEGGGGMQLGCSPALTHHDEMQRTKSKHLSPHTGRQAGPALIGAGLLTSP
jgi:hypothetical protein